MDKDQLLQLLDLTHVRLIFYRDALWEIEKQFAWWVSIVFPAIVVVFTADTLKDEEKLPLVILGCILGFLLSLAGYFLVRRESRYFWEAMLSFNNVAATLKLHHPQFKIEIDKKLETVPILPLYPTTQDFNSIPEINKTFFNLFWSLKQPSSLGIRDWFQIVFLVAGIAYLVFAAVSWNLLK